MKEERFNILMWTAEDKGAIYTTSILSWSEDEIEEEIKRLKMLPDIEFEVSREITPERLAKVNAEIDDFINKHNVGMNNNIAEDTITWHNILMTGNQADYLADLAGRKGVRVDCSVPRSASWASAKIEELKAMPDKVFKKMTPEEEAALDSELNRQIEGIKIEVDKSFAKWMPRKPR